MLICGALAVVTLSLKRAGIPLYLDKTGSGDNMFNRLPTGTCCSARRGDAGGSGRLSRHGAGAARPDWKRRWLSGSCCWWSTI